jgi:ubiquinone/menaquinone biosynthesis C-methylase UbiE
MAIDLSEQCIAACRQRFEAAAHVSFYCNDGKSLAVVDDESVDFVFSFDALPLVDQSTIEAYLTQLPRVLKPNGVAFLHHSNLGRYRRRSRLFAGMPKLELVLRRLGWMERDLHWRDPSVSAELVENLASLHGLRCASQEIFRWGTKRLFIETFTVLVRELSDWRRECVRLENDWFDREVANLSRLARLYVRDCRG